MSSNKEHLMILEIVGTVVCVGAGFGLGRVKNAAKLAAIKSEVVVLEMKGLAAEASVVAFVKKELVALKAKL
jgi:hypothetical protein